MFASKIATFNKVELLSALATGKANSNLTREEYFNIGHPIENPPTLRGTIIIEFSTDFLFDNYAFFRYGSLVDIGALRAGYIKPRISGTSEFKMSFTKFTNMLEKISKTRPSDIEEFLNHKITNRVKLLLEDLLGKEISVFISNEKNPHARIVEFCLESGFEICEKHVKQVHIPNTYLDNQLVKQISERFADKVMLFNPKYGFEGRYVEKG